MQLSLSQLGASRQAGWESRDVNTVIGPRTTHNTGGGGGGGGG